MRNLPYEPSDNLAEKFPVSIKGVIISDGATVLLKNERDEWELPGGKLEPGESPEACVVREIQEELSIKCKVSKILDSWIYTVAPGTNVLIVTYACNPLDPFSRLVCSHEHKQLMYFLYLKLLHCVCQRATNSRLSGGPIYVILA